MTKDLVSVIMPSYNCGRFVEETIRSVQAQTYKNWEILFVDDCSSDDTMEKVLAMKAADSRIKVFQNSKNSGAAISRNRALREAQGEWIAFLDSDDLWFPEKLERQIRFMKENDYHFSYTARNVVDENSKEIGRIATGPKHITERRMFWYCWVGCLSVMYDAKTVGVVQIADLKKNNDYAIWLKAIKKADCYYLDEILATYRVRKGSISHDSKLKLVKWHYLLFKDGENMNAIHACYCTMRNLFFGFFKKKLYVKNFNLDDDKSRKSYAQNISNRRPS